MGDKMTIELLDSLRMGLKSSSEKIRFYNFAAQYADIITWLMRNNHQPHGGPDRYHNTRHLIGVAYLSWRLTHDHAPTVLAGFIHDFRYANKSTDNLNVSESLITAAGYGFFHLDLVRSEDESEIVSIVKATEYDFANPFPELNNPQHQFIRDADQLYATVFFDNEVYQGLEVEVGPKVNCRGLAFLQRNIEYVKNNRFYTDHAKQIFDNYLPKCLQQHNLLMELYAQTDHKRINDMTSQPMQPKTRTVAAISLTPVHQINTVVAIGSDFLVPVAITYNAASEPEALPSLLEAYRLYRGLTPEQYASVASQFTYLWNFRDGPGVHQGADTVDGKLVSVFMTCDYSELPDGKPKAPKVLPAGTYEIWVEGHPRSYGAVKLGEAQGATFKEACIAFFKDDPEFDADRMWRAWGHLFDNEAEARKHFG